MVGLSSCPVIRYNEPIVHYLCAVRNCKNSGVVLEKIPIVCLLGLEQEKSVCLKPFSERIASVHLGP